MLSYIIRRLVYMVVLLVMLSVATFIIIQLPPGDYLTTLVANMRRANVVLSEEAVAVLTERYGLGRPLHIQYLKFLARAVRGEFGNSWQYGLPAINLVLEFCPATFQLALAALLFALVVGIPLGVVSAIREGSLIDALGLSLGVVGRAMPSFWLGIMLILVFAVNLKVLPTSGKGELRHLVLPAITLSTAFLAQIVLLVRSGMLDVLREDYIRTARAKGLQPYTINMRHAFRNTLIPVVTMVGLTFGRLLGGSVITESVFSWPGVGRLAVQAVSARDFPLVQASVVVFALWIVLANLIVDLLYAFLDPRIRYG